MKIKSLKEKEKGHLIKILEKTNWDLAKGSRLLKISLQQLKSKITIHGLKKPGSQ
jgi:transcriptional regulator with GAF, ATPase, and Fis domain